MTPLTPSLRHCLLGLVAILCLTPVDATAQTWRGLQVAPESRCARYSADDYRYQQSIEMRIIDELGGIWSPYTGRTFTSPQDTDIEHIVARSEAHDSGLCAASAATRRQFAMDLLNLTLASPTVNRHQKNDRDAASWLPTQNRCWFADRVVQVRRKYRLTIDRQEANALDQVFNACSSTALVRTRSDVNDVPADAPVSLPDHVAQWDDNGNGQITCAEARAHGIAPVRRDHPAYPYMRDGDGDGVVCESNGRQAPRLAPTPPRATGTSAGPLQQYDDNGNGRITCTEARRHGIAPVRRGHPAYPYMNDRDNDGVVCE